MMHYRAAVATIALISAPAICLAQQPTHEMVHAGAAVPTSPGQAAFGAISEVVRNAKGRPHHRLE